MPRRATALEHTGCRRWTAASPTRPPQELESATTPLLLIDPRPGLRIVDANPYYAAAAMIEAGKLAGERLFDIFPDNPVDPLADGVANLFGSLKIVTENGQPHAMPVQRYDVRDTHGNFVERYWQPTNSPVFTETGSLAFILHKVIDVTEQRRSKTC